MELDALIKWIYKIKGRNAFLCTRVLHADLSHGRNVMFAIDIKWEDFFGGSFYDFKSFKTGQHHSPDLGGFVDLK